VWYILGMSLLKCADGADCGIGGFCKECPVGRERYKVMSLTSRKTLAVKGWAVFLRVGEKPWRQISKVYGKKSEAGKKLRMMKAGE